MISGDSGGATYDAQGEVRRDDHGGVERRRRRPDTRSRSRRCSGSPTTCESGVTSSRYAYGRPAFLGVALGDASSTVAGAYPGTPAAGVGLTEGDTITAVDGTTVSSSSALREAIAGHQPGDTVRLRWTDTSGSSHTATVTLVAGPVA